MVVRESDIAELIAKWTGIPSSRLLEEEAERLLHLEDNLHQRVIGQHDAVVAVSNAIRRARAGLKDEQRPIGSFMFLGPTGGARGSLRGRSPSSCLTMRTTWSGLICLSTASDTPFHG
jgi:ATP-dependent Clp protease ATP-binding subunit ClpA